MLLYPAGGCNLRCAYCDTVYAQGKGRMISVKELAAQAAASKCTLTEITGGEPLIHPETPELCRKLLAEGFEVMLETNGSLPIGDIPAEVRRIIDCKLPGSGMAEYNRHENYALLTPRDEVKFVISSREDFDFALEIIRKYDLQKYGCPLLAGAVAGKLDPAVLADWIIKENAPLRMQIQLHKLLWGDRSGV